MKQKQGSGRWPSENPPACPDPCGSSNCVCALLRCGRRFELIILPSGIGLIPDCLDCGTLALTGHGEFPHPFSVSRVPAGRNGGYWRRRFRYSHECRNPLVNRLIPFQDGLGSSDEYCRFSMNSRWEKNFEVIPAPTGQPGIRAVGQLSSPGHSRIYGATLCLDRPEVRLGGSSPHLWGNRERIPAPTGQPNGRHIVRPLCLPHSGHPRTYGATEWAADMSPQGQGMGHPRTYGATVGRPRKKRAAHPKGHPRTYGATDHELPILRSLSLLSGHPRTYGATSRWKTGDVLEWTLPGHPRTYGATTIVEKAGP